MTSRRSPAPHAVLHMGHMDLFCVCSHTVTFSTKVISQAPGVDYWLAASAFRWVEGAIFEARASLEKANTLASQLPKAGAYERYSCALLCHALDDAGGQNVG